MGTPLLEVDGVSKRFARGLRRSLRYGLADIASEFMPWRARAAPPALRPDEFWALNDVSLTLAPGDALGIVGHNGAGKSTLLRIIAGLLKPDAGEVRSTGRQGAVIELGSGFNATLSGRDNANLILAWRAIPASQRPALVEQIEAFAELGEMFDAPLVHYSTGMRARLAYAIAVAPPNDLLVLDEALAVGDVAFQRKCLRFLSEHLDRGGALIFVSHNIYQLQTLCNRGILLDRGRIAYAGSATEAATRLLDMQASPPVNANGAATTAAAADGGEGRIIALSITGPADGLLRNGEPAAFALDIELAEPAEAICSIVVFTDDLSNRITTFVRPEPLSLLAGRSRVQCSVPKLPLAGGRFRLRATLSDPRTLHPIATFGWSGSGMPVRVDGATDRHSVVMRGVGDLVTTDSFWAHASQPSQGSAPD